MKIEFEVPEWAIGRHLYIFAGTELLGKQECQISHDKEKKHFISYFPLKIKPEDGRCSGCGICCKTTGFLRSHLVEIKKALHGFKDYNGPCPFLTDEGCLMGARIPFSCVRSICTDYDGCTEQLEMVI